MTSKLIKNKTQLIIVILTIGLFFSCKNQAVIDDTGLKVENSTLETKLTLKEQLKNEAGYGNLNKKDLNNLNIINGFRNVKLGSDINSYSLDGCDKSRSIINTKYSNIEFNFNCMSSN